MPLARGGEVTIRRSKFPACCARGEECRADGSFKSIGVRGRVQAARLLGRLRSPIEREVRRACLAGGLILFVASSAGAAESAPLELRYRVYTRTPAPEALPVSALTQHFDWLRAHGYSPGRHDRGGAAALSVVVEALDIPAAEEVVALAALFRFGLALVLPPQTADVNIAGKPGTRRLMAAIMGRPEVQIAIPMSRLGPEVVARRTGERGHFFAHRAVAPDDMESDHDWLQRVVQAAGRRRAQLERAGIPAPGALVWPVGQYRPKLAAALKAAGFAQQFNGDVRGLAGTPALKRAVVIRSAGLTALVAGLDPPVPAPIRAVRLAAGRDASRALGLAATIPLTGIVGASVDAAWQAADGLRDGVYLEVATAQPTYRAFDVPTLRGVVLTAKRLPPPTLERITELAGMRASIRPATAIGVRMPMAAALAWRQTLVELTRARRLDLVFLEVALDDGDGCRHKAAEARDAFLPLIERPGMRPRLVVVGSRAAGAIISGTALEACLAAFRYAGFDSFALDPALLEAAPAAAARQIRVAPLPEFPLTSRR